MRWTASSSESFLSISTSQIRHTPYLADCRFIGKGMVSLRTIIITTLLC